VIRVISRWTAAQSKHQVQRKPKSHGLSESLITVHAPTSASAEAYRTLGTKLLLTRAVSRPRVIVTTSPGSREGRSITCANLGVVLARANENTLILDCDFRTPAMHELFGLDNLCGVTDVLAGQYTLHEVWQKPLPSLTVVTAGAMPLDPVELLTSSRFADFLHHVRKEFDYVLIDTASAGSVSDPAILASLSDGVLLVLDAQSTPKVSVRRSVRSLEAVGANILGTVMNNVVE
jgi:capsular exopolysaccharide synthesis family protein